MCLIPGLLSDHPHYRFDPVHFLAMYPFDQLSAEPFPHRPLRFVALPLSLLICLLCFMPLYSVLHLLCFHIHLGPSIKFHNLVMVAGEFDIHRIVDEGSVQTYLPLNGLRLPRPEFFRQLDVQNLGFERFEFFFTACAPHRFLDFGTSKPSPSDLRPEGLSPHGNHTQFFATPTVTPHTAPDLEDTSSFRMLTFLECHPQ